MHVGGLDPDEIWRTGRTVCASMLKGRECGATVAIGEEHLPCDICRGMKRRTVAAPVVTRWAKPIEFRYRSAVEHGPELPPDWQERILDELAADWARATGSDLEAKLP